MNTSNIQNSNSTTDELQSIQSMPNKMELQNLNQNNILSVKPQVSASSNNSKTPKTKASKLPSQKQPSPIKTPSTPKKPGDKPEDNAFSIQQWREWKGKYSAKDSNGFHCLVCPEKSYSTERALLRHYKQVHELICAQCRICFSEEDLLKQHRKETHEFWCFPCSKVYTTSRALRRHNQQQHGISQSKSVTLEQLGKTENVSTGEVSNIKKV